MIDQYINTIQNVDCIEFMKTLPDKSVDLTLTDFPYGVGVEYDSLDFQAQYKMAL